MNVIAEREPQLQVQPIAPSHEGELSLVERARLDAKFGLKGNDVAVPDVFKEALKPEKTEFDAPETRMDLKWSSFGQILLVQELKNAEGKRIKKIAGISLAFPAGVGNRMTEEILTETLDLKDPKVETWDGVEEGKLVAMSKPLPPGDIDLGIIDRLIDTSENVIRRRHPEKENEHVQHFFTMQQGRKDSENLTLVKAKVNEILTTPRFLGKSAFDAMHEGTGVYVVEMIVEDDVLDGADPYGKRTKLSKVAADDPHKKWLNWLENTVVYTYGNQAIGDGEDTETVHGCGGQEDQDADAQRRACSDYFEEMEGNGLKLRKTLVDNTFTGTMARETIRMANNFGYIKDNEYVCIKCKRMDTCACNADESDSGNEA